MNVQDFYETVVTTPVLFVSFIIYSNAVKC